MSTKSGETVEDAPPTNIMHAAYVGALELVKGMVESGTPADQPDSLQGSTPLHWACFGGHLNVVRWLVQKAGADPNRPNNDGCTPLLFACERGHTGVAQWLVREGGVEVNAKDFTWQTPLHRVFFNAKRNRSSVTMSDEENLILWLVEAGADISAMDRFGKRVEEAGKEESGGDSSAGREGARGALDSAAASAHSSFTSGDGSTTGSAARNKLVEMIVAAREDAGGEAREKLRRRSSALRSSTVELTVQLSPKMEAKQRVPLSRSRRGRTPVRLQDLGRSASGVSRGSGSIERRTSGGQDEGGVSGPPYSSPRSSPPHGGGSGGSGGGVAAPPAGSGERVGGGPPAPAAAGEDISGENVGGSSYMTEMVAFFGGGKVSRSESFRSEHSGRLIPDRERQRRVGSKVDDEKRDLQSIRVAEEALRKAGLETSVAQAALIEEDLARKDEAIVVEMLRDLALKKAAGQMSEEEFVARRRQVLEMEQLRREAEKEARKREKGEALDLDNGILTSVGQNTPPPSPKEGSDAEPVDDDNMVLPAQKPTAKDLRRTYKASDLEKYSIVKSIEPRVSGPVPECVKESLAAREATARQQNGSASNGGLDAALQMDKKKAMHIDHSATASSRSVDSPGLTANSTVAGGDEAGGAGARKVLGVGDGDAIRDPAIHGRSCCSVM